MIKITGALVLLAILYVMLRKSVFAPEFLYAGTIEATDVNVPARVASVIRSIEIQEGDRVEKGQKLVQLACEDIELRARLASENYERARRLYRAGTLPQQQFDEALNEHQDSQTRLGWCTIESPISGVVESRYQEPGEWVNPGTKLVSLTNPRDVWTYIYVPQDVIYRLKPGMKLPGLLPEMHNRRFEGTVLKVNAEAEFTPKNVQTREERTRLVFGVKVGFENAEEILKPGMTVELRIPEP